MQCSAKSGLCLSHDLQAWWASSHLGDVLLQGSGSTAPYRHSVKGRAGRACGASLWEGCVSLEVSVGLEAELCSPGFLCSTTWTYTAEPPSWVCLWMYILVSQETLIVSITMSFIRVVFPFTTHQILTALLTLVRRLQKANRASLFALRGYLVRTISVRPNWTQWPLLIKDFRTLSVPQNHSRGEKTSHCPGLSISGQCGNWG